MEEIKDPCEGCDPRCQSEDGCVERLIYQARLQGRAEGAWMVVDKLIEIANKLGNDVSYRQGMGAGKATMIIEGHLKSLNMPRPEDK